MSSRVPGRSFAPAGAAREYLAGIATSGSLLVVAALLFVVCSAMVAFRGWPHVGAQPSPGEVVISPRPTAATGSPVARRLAGIAAGPAGTPRAPVIATVRGGGAGRALAGPVGGTRRSIGQPASISRPVPVTGGTPSLPAAGAA